MTHPRLSYHCIKHVREDWSDNRNIYAVFFGSRKGGIKLCIISLGLSLGTTLTLVFAGIGGAGGWGRGPCPKGRVVPEAILEASP